MIEVVLRKIRPGKVDRLRAWLKELNDRKDEVRQTFEQETVRHERGYILETNDGPILVYVVEAEDHDKGLEAYKASTLPIDQQHKEVMADCLGDPADAELLYDVRLEEKE
jgi:Family of unknown function (DUF6176)